MLFSFCLRRVAFYFSFAKKLCSLCLLCHWEFHDALTATRIVVRRKHIPLRVYRNKYDENNNKLCLNCGRPVIGRRSGAKYCCNDCSWNFYVKNNWHLLRMKVLRRDGFRCQKCGDRRSRINVNGRHRRNLQVDHKIPLFKGGKEFDESNLWTLCTVCHREKTRTELRERVYHKNGIQLVTETVIPN